MRIKCVEAAHEAIQLFANRGVSEIGDGLNAAVYLMALLIQQLSPESLQRRNMIDATSLLVATHVFDLDREELQKNGNWKR
jgi:hypothetical protein